MDITEHNRVAWNAQSTSGESQWCVPVSSAEIAAARSGDWQVVLTPTVAVPKDWFGDLPGKTVLCLASGGGQQAPILAAAGASVTSFDNSEEQLAKDRLVAERERLDLSTHQGDMKDLSCFHDGQFDLIFHPVSNLFVPDILPVWQECQRVLKPQGRLLVGFMNPVYYLFDHDNLSADHMEVKYKLPYRDTEQLSQVELQNKLVNNEALEFSHSLETQLQGQLQAGFVIAGFFEDRWTSDATPLNQYTPTSMATLAIRA